MDPITSATAQSALQIAEHVVKRQVGYIFNYKDKFKEVEQYIERLDDTRKRVQNEVNDAEKNGEEINDEVQHWLKQVDEKIKKYECFIDDERHAQTRCSIRLIFPNNLSLRYRLGRKATKIVEEIKADGHSNKKFDKVSYRLGPSSDAALLNTGYVSFGSRNETMEKIMKALEDSTVNIVGVYGAGGVGKTTLVKEVANKAREKKLFNMVVMANVTRIPDREKIQGQIAEMLGMRLEEESEIVRADRIRKRLMNEKENTLIILDDLWDGLNLNILGIPRSEDDDGSQQDVNDLSDFGYHKMEKEVFSADFHTMKKDKLAVDFNTMKKGKLSVDSNMIKKEKLSGDHKGCKILLTSRSKEVICNKMDVQERSTFSVGVLDENEAKSFLKKLAGIRAQSFEFDEKVIEIAKMCDGLPMALVSIGRALKNKSSFVWQDVCQRIKRQSFTEGHESIEFSVNLSFEHLKNEQLKHIFLLCARMGNDALIMDLVKFCIGLGLLQGVHTIREARNKVNMLIEELKESTLLVESLSHDRFNMHDIVRDVALSISSKEKHVFFMKNGIVDEWPHKDELERYTAICLHFCDINDGLPESIHCPRLEVLHIDSKDDFLKIPDDFFKDMIELRVLILTGVNLSCLPSSIKCLKKLRMLSLERCTLGENLSIIGELKKLRILTLSGSNIESLPLEFGQLDKLQLFDISNCSKLRVIPSNTISRMNSLEEFYMRDSLILWEAEENIQSQKAILSELRHLNQLQNLDVHIQSVSHFPQNLFLDMLDSYKIVIGEFNMLKEGEFKIPDMYDQAKFLALNLKEGIDIHSETWVKMLFKSVEYLLLGELNDVHDVFYELNVEGFPYLKHLSIVNNFGIQYIINSVERFHPLLAFPKLESMCLYKLDNLEKICGNNHLEEASFCRLKVIKIKTCDKLENIFPFFMVGLLTMLETIEVCDCDSLKEIVSIERQTHTINDDKIEFPQLRLLTLKSLPAFACLYTNDKMPCSAQSLEVQVQNRNKDIITEVEQGATSSCISLFNEKVSIPKLEWLELSSINIQKIWSDQSQHCFQNLLTLNVTDCGDLKYLLSFSMAGSLMNLQSLFVSACEMMEDIFCPEHAEQNIDVFPKLKKMEIIGMEKLNTIWQPHIGLHSFHSLDSLIIGECHKLVTIFPSYMGQRFQSLQSLTITNCQLVENIFDFEIIPQTGVRNETNLQNVFLKALPNLVHIWKEDSSEILKYNNLKSISINESPNLKHLFPLSVATDLEKLEILDVYNCRAMKEIVAWGNGSNENAITFKFPQLNTVSLQNSFELMSFYRGTHALEWPSLKKLSILNCFKLEGLTKDITNSQGKSIVSATEKVIYNLESMEISLKEAEWLQKYIVSVHRMHKLQRLVLYGLKNTEILFWFLHRLPNLKSLTLGSCQLKSIWAPASLISRDKIGVVMQLKELELKSLLSLEEIGFEHHPLLQRIERLVISRCMKLTNLASSIVSYNYITHLEVRNCRSLRNLMTSSTAKSLVQLTTMKVFLCEMIVEIVAENEEEKVQEIEFRQLKSLELVSLKNLTSFCSSEKCDFKFPLLESLVVSECPQMKKFSRVQSAPNLKKVHVVAGEKDKWYWEGDLNGTLQKHFTDQVSFEYSKHKRLVDYPETKGFRHGKPAFPENFFGCLKKLEFDGESIREIVIPSHVLPYLKTLEELYVHSSHAVQIIFDTVDSEAKTKGIVFRLKKLILEDLSNLKCVWNKTPQGILSFSNLQDVDVTECRSLATLFPLSLARNLGKLKTLHIFSCQKLVEIVGKEDLTEHATTEMFEFPSLWKLILLNLSLLSCFYPGKYHMECPILENLYVSYCPKLKLFTSEFRDSPKQAVIEAPISQLQQQPLFSVEKIPINLKELTLNEENIMLLSDGHLPQDLLFKLRSLHLSFENYDNKKDTLPFDFLQKVPSLEHLLVQRCYGLKEIFPSQKLQVHDRSLPALKQLILLNLGELESIGLEHPWVQPYSQKLQLLNLINCSQLEKLVSCAVSFINLKQLEVKCCNRMEYLLKFSTAKSLLQLERLSIRECESMKEIVKKEEEDGSDEIIFGRLRRIMLDSLPRLVRFYSGNATLHFKCLEEATIAECQNMKTFSEGIIDAPLLEGIKTSTDDTDHLTSHHDLNTTIETLFHQQVFFEYSKHMILLDYLEATGVRHGKPAFLKNIFGSLKKLEFDGAIKREIVIPSHVLPYLKTLEELNVHSSDAAQVIFDIDDTDANPKGMVLPLKNLTLKRLPNLKCVWNKTPQGILSFSNLQDVDVTECRSLATLFPLSLARNLGKLKTLQIFICQKLVEIVGKEDVTEHATTVMFEFPSLWKLLLCKLSLLSCFYPGKHHLECPFLTSLRVSYCPKLKLFTSEFRDSPKQAVIEAPISQLQQQPLFSVEKIPINLKELTLNEENIMLLSDGHLPQDLLFKLRSLHLSFENDDNKKDTLPFDFLQKVPSLEHLLVQRCYGLKEIFPSQKLQVHDRSLPALKQLILLNLGELESIGLEHPWVQPYSQKLQLLHLINCSQLEKLVSCAVSFINLKELEVTYCNRMEYLLKFSTAKSLLQLERLSIRECESMKEIVKKEEEDGSDEIIFGRLRRIMLDSLPRLVRFYSGNATLHLKCLEEATIAECQNMKTFSEGIIDAPLLEGIKTSTDNTDHLTSHHDLNTTIETLFHQQVFFEYSKHMILLDYLEATGVRHGKPAFLKNIFGSLKKLEFDGAIKREIVIPSHVLPYLKTLEELNVHSSDAAQVIFDIDDTDANPKGMVLPLKNLTLKRLPNLKCVWNKTPQGILSFSNLQDVDVTECRSLATLFPLSLARNLGKLKTLQIFICQKLVEIVGKEDVTEHATTVMFEFPSLWKLLLCKLSLLSCFYPGKHHLECPFLTSLRVSYCPKLKLFTSEFRDSPKQAVIEAPISQLQQQPLFSVEKIAINLKELTLNEENIMLLSDGHLPQDLLFKLRFLHLSFENDDNKIDTLPFDFLQKVPSLEHLLVQRCYGLKEIFPSQKLQVHDRSLPALKQLILLNLGELESIGLEHPWVQPYSQKLQLLNLINCSQLEKLVSCAVSFINLKQLEVKCCNRMEYLLKFSTAKSLLQLERLSIRECESMKEIVKKEEEDGSDEIIFGRLRRIMLDSLPRLVRFYSGNATLHLKCLEEATIAECQNMKTFSEGIIDAPLLEGIKTSTEDTDLTSHHDLNTTIQTLFHQQVFFEYSKQMILVDYLETTGVRRGKPAFLKNFFGSLKKLEFDGAIKREIVIPSDVLPYLKTLQELNVHSSDAAQVIFDIDDTDTNTKGMVLPLKKLILKDLSNLKCVWNKTPRGILSFPNLQLVFVTKCRSLATLFPLSLAKNLVNLQTLTVWRCDKLVEIVGKEDAMELGRTEIFEFPCLSKLYLFKLSLLSCFYPGKHHLECPLLESLDVSYCPKLKLFTSEFHNSHKEAVIEQPLFMVEKVDPKLKELTLNEENIILLRDAHLPQDFLCKLNILDLSFDDYENKKDTLPFDFLHKVPSVECLRVQRCYGLKEIFPSQKLQVHHGILARLNELYLFKLKELESIGLEHPWVKPYSAKLETLEIRKCSRLEKVVSCAVSFSSLKELQVSECERMEYLFTSSTAKSLVQLKMLYIEKCESIKEIVRKEDESDASEEMIFGRLTKLRLESLGRLVRFYSGDGTLQFSCLEEATIAECPNMNTFSEGFVNAPMFEGIKTSREDSDLTFHHDLNSTIKKLFHQHVEKSACDIEHLKFDDHHHLEEIWLGAVPIPSKNCFNSLKSLTVVEFESLPNVIPFYLLRFLCNLKEIEVSNCHSVKAIFDMKGAEADMKPASQISLPLKKLILNQLPNLEHIWNPNPDEILSLQEVCISNCQSLKSLFPTSVANHLAKLDVRSCATLEEIFLENEAALKGETKPFNFHCLTSLTLWELPELKYFYNGKHSLEWPMLTQLDVYHCDKLKLFTTEHHSGEVADIEYPLRASIDQQAVFSVEKVMPSLEHQATTCEDNMIGQGQFVANAAHLLQNLKVLKLMCYHEDDESNIFSSGLLEEISSIENLEVFCSSFNEIFSSQIPSTNYTKVLSKLKKLHLKSLQQLNSIGLEHSWVEPLLKTLETLEVFSCPNMKNLVPSTVSFSNLTSLNVEECHGLVYLFTSSTAKSLGQLKHMSIRDCQAIQEIVSREGDHESNDEEITFEQLRVLSLESLPSIVGIYSGKYKLKFPSLDQVTLMECPQMKYSYVPDLHQFKLLEQI
ncbi:putative disease resistance protein [Glycine max]|nr:putative disease resistance protein [Glycine max]